METVQVGFNASMGAIAETGLTIHAKLRKSCVHPTQDIKTSVYAPLRDHPALIDWVEGRQVSSRSGQRRSGLL
jgi:hypothetical protein